MSDVLFNFLKPKMDISNFMKHELKRRRLHRPSSNFKALLPESPKPSLQEVVFPPPIFDLSADAAILIVGNPLAFRR